MLMKCWRLRQKSGQTIMMIASGRVPLHYVARAILKRNVKIDFVDSRFITPHFAYGDITQTLLEKGVNPFVVDHTENTQFQRWAASFSHVEQELLNRYRNPLLSDQTSIYYSLRDLTCADYSCLEGCSDKMEKFRCYNGVKGEKLEKLGQGGQGKVYKGQWHGEEAAFKHINMQPIAYGRVTNEAVIDSNRTIEEFLQTSELKHDNILTCWGSFRQQVLGVNETVFVFPFCQENLRSVSDGKFQLFFSLISQAINGLEFIVSNKKSHGDIKPDNLLIQSTGDGWRLRIADFGMLSAKGGTPIYASPEFSMDERVIEKSDLYSLGITILFRLVEMNLALKLLYLPVRKNHRQFRCQIQKNKVLSLICRMTELNYGYRTTFKIVKAELDTISVDFVKTIDEQSLIEEGISVGALEISESPDLSTELDFRRHALQGSNV